MEAREIKDWYIQGAVRLYNDGTLFVNGEEYKIKTPDALKLYQHLQLSYPKFFKMDLMCKWSIVASELLKFNLIQEQPQLGNPYGGSIIIHTNAGCSQVDKAYWQSAKEIASPALFVYTLPNIVLGELAIKNGWKGPQTNLALSKFSPEILELNVREIVHRNNVEQLICGWIDTTKEWHELVLFYLSKIETKWHFDSKSCAQFFNAEVKNH